MVNFVADHQMESTSSAAMMITTNSPPHSSSSLCTGGVDKKHWWLSTKKIVDKYVRDARILISSRDMNEMTPALTLLDSALSLSPRCEVALELKARCLLYLRRFKDVADMLQDYIPSYRITSEDSDISSSSSSSSSTSLGGGGGGGSGLSSSSDGSGSSNNSNNREKVKLLPASSSYDSGFEGSFKCFSVSDLKKKLLAGLNKNCDKEGQWRYVVLGQACCHLGLMDDAVALLQTGKRLASAAFRRESICWSEDSFSFSHIPLPSSTSSGDSPNHPNSIPTYQTPPLTESESITHLLAQIKLLLRRRTAALAALDAGLYTEAIRHFSKILDGRRAAPQAFLAECYMHRSIACSSAGRIADSIADCNRTLALDTNHVQALQHRASLYELIGRITDAVHDLEHVKFLYNSILRDRKLPGPAWKPQCASYREIPGKLISLNTKIEKMKNRIAMGETENVDYYKLIGLRRGCSRSELERAHLLLVLKHRPDKSIGFIDRCEFADERDIDTVKEKARCTASLFYRWIQKGYSSVMTTVMAEEAAEKERKKAALASQETAAIVLSQQQQEANQQQVQQQLVQKKASEIMVVHPQKQSGVGGRSSEMAVVAEKIMIEENKSDHYHVGSGDGRSGGSMGPSCGGVYQGVFCRDLAAVGSLLSQAGFSRPIPLKYEASTY